MAQDGYDNAEVLIVSTKEADKNWIMDSRCSFHMIPNKDWFETFEDVHGGQVILGNNKIYEVMGIGTVRIKMHDGVERVLQKVRYIPRLKRNLISLGTLDVKGFNYKASSGVLSVTKGRMVVMKGNIENGMYVLQGKTVIGFVSVVTEDSDQVSLLWHNQLGHVSERGLKELKKKGLLCGDRLGKLQFCENCILGKAKILKFSRSEHVTSGILNYIHSDL